MLLAAAGFLISIYAYLLEQKIKKQPTYQPICDISPTFSCSKPILGDYGKILGFSNSLAGSAFYIVQFLLALLGHAGILFYLSLLGALASLFLAYILYVKIRTVCLVCTALYAINALLLILSYIHYT
jgi:vitamin-K-epoxide reductase (warfarin-sensitive)